MNNNLLHIYTDGACRNNGKANAIGGYAYIVVLNGNYLKHLAVTDLPDVTNNVMELTAFLKAVKYLDAIELILDQVQDITIFTDSEYVMKGVTQWSANWEKKDYKDVKNASLWKDIMTIYNRLNKEFVIWVRWVRAHQKDDSVETYWNNKVDQLAAGKIKSIN